MYRSDTPFNKNMISPITLVRNNKKTESLWGLNDPALFLFFKVFFADLLAFR